MTASDSGVPGQNDCRPLRRSGVAARIFSWSNAHPTFLFALLSVWYIALVWRLAARPLWFDELSTYYIAQQPTLARMLEAIQTIDLNPPLNYFLTRWSIDLFGTSPWATRLPALLGFWLGCAAIYAILRRRAPTLIAATGVLLFWSSAYLSYAAEARPYGLLLGLTALLLAAWDPPAEGHAAFQPVLVAAVGTLLLLSHVFGLLSLGAIWIGEAVWCWRRRRLSWAMLLALFFPLIATFTYRAMFRTVQGATFSPEAQVTWGKLGFLYYAVFRWMWRPLLVLAFVMYFARRKRSRMMSKGKARVLGSVQAPGRMVYPRYSPEAATVLGVLFVTPIALTLLFFRSHTAFYDRYGMTVVIPIALVAALFFASWTMTSPRSTVAAFTGVGLCLLLSTTLRGPVVHAANAIFPSRVATKFTGLLMTSPHGPFRPWWKKLAVPAHLLAERGQAPRLSSLESFHPELPLVAASELTFVEMDHRESARLTARLCYLYDRQAEIEIAHRSVTGTMFELKDFFPFRGSLQPYNAFVAKYRQFLVIGLYEHSGDWLLRKLEADGAQLEIVARGDRYDDSDIYLVTYPAPAP